MNFLKRMKNHMDRIRLNVLVVIVINLFLFYGLFSFLLADVVPYDNSASAHDIYREAVDPGEVEGLDLPTPEVALIEANIQLETMTEGGIYTIDDTDFYNAAFFRDYELGDIYYWELWDSDTSVLIDAKSCEIITYMQIGYHEGSLMQAEIETRAVIIANQFSFLPEDKAGPDTIFEVGSITQATTNYEDFEDIEEISNDWWYVTYDRTKDSIHAEDHIILILAPNGDLISYRKHWNMDLSSFGTSYSVSEGLAESNALDHAGSGSSIVSSEKKIVRPNHYWTMEYFQYGLDPVCVWEIFVKDVDNGLRTYHIHGNENTIIGGDICEEYYGDEYYEEE